MMVSCHSGIGSGLAVDLGDQEVVLMNMERMVRERAVEDRPFFVVAGDHVGKQRLIRREQSFLLEVHQWHVRVVARRAFVIIIPQHL